MKNTLKLQTKGLKETDSPLKIPVNVTYNSEQLFLTTWNFKFLSTPHNFTYSFLIISLNQEILRKIEIEK